MNFHHMGYVVNSIFEYEQHIFFNKKIIQVYDEVQDAEIALYDNYGAGFIELIEPKSAKSFTYNALKKFGSHHHHLCYEVNSKEELKQCIGAMILVKGPLPAVIFDGKEVYFYYSRNKTIVEFLING